MLPGVDFGRPASELTARLSYVDFDGARALAAAEFSTHDQPLNEDFVMEYCPHVVQAVDRICAWLQNSSSPPPFTANAGTASELGR